VPLTLSFFVSLSNGDSDQLAADQAKPITQGLLLFPAELWFGAIVLHFRCSPLVNIVAQVSRSGMQETLGGIGPELHKWGEFHPD
jgi:hypothetical protein